jgi:PhzF family phenazine biosynthesis protein
MGIPIYQVDAFTRRPFHGNPATVVMLSEAKPDDWMLAVAQEMKHSETAFLLKQEVGYNLRWFTPTNEVDLCGHATLACAHILYETGRQKPEEIVRFSTRSGLVTARRSGTRIEMNFPTKPVEPVQPPDGLLQALGGLAPRYVGHSGEDYLLELENENLVRMLQPDLAQLKALPLVKGVLVTATSDSSDYDFVSRFFSPVEGIDEDPVTGMAHCMLGPYWGTKLNRAAFTAYQASKRGGEVRLRVDGNRIFLSGEAMTIFTGEMRME